MLKSERLRKTAGLVFLLAAVGLVGFVLYLSWVPDPAMKDQAWLPRWVARWADRYDQLRTGVPLVPLGLMGGFYLAYRRAPLPFWVVVWGGLSGLVLLAELGQLLLPRRSFDLMDIFWGSLGVLAGMVPIAVWSLLRCRRMEAKGTEPANGPGATILPMTRTKTFLGIPFWNGTTQELLKAADAEGGLFTVPSAPSLAMMRTDGLLAKAYQSSDWAVVDGGYVALVLRFCFGRNLPRISGLQILQRLVGEKDKRSIPFDERTTLWVVPSEAEKQRIDYFLEDSGFSRDKRHWYYAPFYKTDADFQDEALAKVVTEVKPDWVVLCIGGGKQEKVAYYLRTLNEETAEGARKNGPVILCTGGAIAFLTGGQANIPTWADRLYLGWFFRVLQSPKTFFPRYWNAGYEFPRLLWEWRGRLFS